MSKIRKNYGQVSMNLLVLNLTATNYIQDKDGNIVKNAYSATNKFNEHFCSIHKVFKDPNRVTLKHPF